MPFAAEQDEAPYPMNIRLLGPVAIMLVANGLTKLLQQPGPAIEELADYRRRRWRLLGFADACARRSRDKHWDVRETFACGYQHFGGFVERPCPKDPRFPIFEDELQFRETPSETHWKWQCYAIGKTVHGSSS